MSVIIWSVLVGVGIALHIFVVMMETGATQGGLGKKKIFALGAIFLGVQICMQTCGILLTWWIKQYLHIAALERIYKTDDIHSFVFDTDRAFDPMKLERYFMSLTSVYGEDLLRYKGVLNLQGSPNRVVVQGVHMLAVSDVLGPWGDRKQTSRLVFIGRNLHEEAIRRGLQTCLV